MLELTYPKIQTLFKREEGGKKKGHIIEGDYSRPEFLNIRNWRLSEKVDGTNIRINYRFQHTHSPEGLKQVAFGGKTDAAQIPQGLGNYLKDKFTVEFLSSIFPDCHDVYLFGEGYGKNIQSAGKDYQDEQRFILFDAWIDGWWVEPDNVKDISVKLGIPSVPDLGTWTILDDVPSVLKFSQIIDFVRRGEKSRVSKNPDLVMEGIVARATPMMYFRDKEPTPIMFKLKFKDFKPREKEYPPIMQECKGMDRGG